MPRPSLARVAPRLVTVWLDAWGGTGPWSHDRGFDSLVQSASGIAWLYGEAARRGADDEPMRRPGALPVQALDYAAGCLLAAATWALLVHRERTGRLGGAHVSLAAVAHQLLALPVPQDEGAPIAIELQESDSPHGRLLHAAPLFSSTDDSIAFPFPPRRYGGDPLTWSQALQG